MSDTKKKRELRLVKDGKVFSGTLMVQEEGVTSINPSHVAIFASLAPTIREFPERARPGELWLAFYPSDARTLGQALLDVAQELDSDRH